MPLVFLLIFGGVLLAYMGLKNESFKGILSDTLDPISGKTNEQQQFGTADQAIIAAGNAVGTGVNSTVGGLTPSSASGLFGVLFGGVTPKVNRHDQGRDLQVQANQIVSAPGNAMVLRNGYDPSGFGISYPILRFTSGPWAGLDVYFGHIKSLVSPGQSITAGQAIGQTQNGSGPYVGNATGLPGWIEIGRAPGGNPGPLGQSLLPGL